MMSKMVVNYCTITHAEVPLQFLNKEPKQRPRAGSSRNEEGRQKIERDKVPKREVKVHPLLKKHLVDNVFSMSKGETVTEVCNFCNTNVHKLTKNTNKCMLNMLGMCKRPKYSNKHETATYEEVEHVVSLTEKSISDPALLKKLRQVK